MSNAIIYDSLLVRGLARELSDRLAGRRVLAVRFDSGDAVLEIDTELATIEWALHPSEGWLRRVERRRRRAQGNLRLPPAAVVTAVDAPPDERLIRIGLRATGADPAFELPARGTDRDAGQQADDADREEHADPARGADRDADRDAGQQADDADHEEHADPTRVSTIVVELIPNRWNAVAVRPDGVVAATLRTLRGARAARPGQPYPAPAPTHRAGATTPVGLAEWRRALQDVPPSDREAALIRKIAYTSGINAAAILGDAADGAVAADRADGVLAANARDAANAGNAANARDVANAPSAARVDDDVARTSRDARALDDAYARYLAIVAADLAACLLLDGLQPYPVRLPGVAAEPAPSLLDAFEAAAERRGAAPRAASELPPGRALRAERRRERALAATWRALERATRKRDRLEQERAGARPEAERLRREADLLLSQLHRVGRGERTVTLDDYEGGEVRVEIDPSVPPAENANRLYARARKRERAAAALPALIERTTARAAQLEALAARIDAGDRDAVREAAERFRRRVSAKMDIGPALPYRRYRTSGGFEVRVGKGSRTNDELTFHHSSPDDIWMHARQVGGAHVVLRWGERDANPPARDLREAAVLAALHSKARTSGTVPVDWTRRKYVRKPRKAPPGRVVIERAKTVFVEPDPAVEARMKSSE